MSTLLTKEREIKRKKTVSLDRIWTWSIHLKGAVFSHLTTKDRLTKRCADYIPKLISIYKIIAESRLNLRIDFKMVSFLSKFGNRHFPLFKIVSYRVIIHVYSGISKKKVLKY